MGQPNRLLMVKRSQTQKDIYHMVHIYEVQKQEKLTDSVRSQDSGYLSERRRDWYGLGGSARESLRS